MTAAGYLCKTCNGPAPLGVGFVDDRPGAYAASVDLVACQCGNSALPSTLHHTRADVIQREILPALGEYADGFDVDAIADQVVDTVGSGTQLRFRIAVDEPTFWEVVQRHELPFVVTWEVDQ